MNTPIDFHVPKGIVPEGTKPGDTFDFVTTYRLKEDGKVCVITIGDVNMPGYDDKKEEPKTRQYKDEGMGMMQSFKESGYS